MRAANPDQGQDFYVSLPFLLFAFNRFGISRTATRAALTGVAAFVGLFLIALVLRAKMEAFSVSWWLMMVSPYVRIFDFVIGLCLGLLFNRLQGMRERWFDVPPLHRARNRVARVSRRAVSIDVAKVADAG